MPFQKGKSGNPAGRTKDKPWADALRLAVHRNDAQGRKLLAAIAESCVNAAASGDMQAIREIGDRLDGKAHQTIEASHEVEHRYVARLPEKTKTVEEWQKQHEATTLQ